MAQCPPEICPWVVYIWLKSAGKISKVLGAPSNVNPALFTIFKSSCHLPTTLSRGLTLYNLNPESQAGKLRIPVFIVFSLTRPEIEPKLIISEGNVLLPDH